MPTPANVVAPIDDQPRLDALSEQIRGLQILGVDTEFVRTDTYRPKLCLVQVATTPLIGCIDTLAPLAFEGVWQSLSRQELLVVAHAAKQDLEALMRHMPRLPARLFDTQIAAAFLGHPPQTGYAALVEAELGHSIAKTQTRTDWSRRPLTPEQLHYAAEDVAHLRELYDTLSARLSKLGREKWVAEDSSALLNTSLYTVDPDQAWERLPALGHLQPATQARARRLAAWRERRADSADRPRQWILTDAVILELAHRNPENIAALETIEGLTPGIVRRTGEQLLGELRAAAEDLADGRMQISQVPRNGSPDSAALKRLGGIVQEAGKDAGVSPELLATRKELAALMRGDRNVRPLSGWRESVVGRALLSALG
jgi:ribonuclease D